MKSPARREFTRSCVKAAAVVERAFACATMYWSSSQAER
jgi:hypothetical protein